MPIRIIICEDDKGISEVVGIALASEGYEPIPVAEHDHISKAIREHKPHIVLLDLHLHNENGENVISEIKSVRDNAPKIILMSAHNNLPAIAGRHGVDYLAKPFDLDELKRAIKRNMK